VGRGVGGGCGSRCGVMRKTLRRVEEVRLVLYPLTRGLRSYNRVDQAGA